MSTDVVCVLDSSLTQVFELARPIKATVKEEAKTMEHPLETGATITDHRVVLPVQVELSLVLSSAEYQQVYQQIRGLFLRADLLTVQTRTGSYENQLIVAMPHEETGDMQDGTTLALKLREALFVEPEFSELRVIKVANPKNTSTVKRGEQQAKTAPQEPRKASILSGIFK